MDAQDDSKGPGVKVPPPLIVVAVVMAAYGLHQWVPLNLPFAELCRWLGSALMTLGLLILLFAAAAFFRAKTAIEPWKPARVLMTDGLYRFSRNPIYLALYLIQIGLGLYLAQGWIVLSVIISEGWIYRLVIKKEELYLEKAFGSEYCDYKSRVRRYI